MCETERQAKMELIEFDRFAEQDDCDKYNMLQQSACEIRALENKNKQLKEVIDEVREYIEKHHSGNLKITFGGKLLQILDKTGESNE